MFSSLDNIINGSKDISVADFKEQMKIDEEAVKNELEQHRKQDNFFDFVLDERTPEDIKATEYLRSLVENEKREEIERKIRFKKYKTEKCYGEYFEEVKRLNTNIDKKKLRF